MTLTKTQGQAKLSLGYSSMMPDLFQICHSCPMFFGAEIQQQVWFCLDHVTEPKPQGMGQFDQVSRFRLLDCSCFELLHLAGIVAYSIADVGP